MLVNILVFFSLEGDVVAASEGLVVVVAADALESLSGKETTKDLVAIIRKRLVVTSMHDDDDIGNARRRRRCRSEVDDTIILCTSIVSTIYTSLDII